MLEHPFSLIKSRSYRDNFGGHVVGGADLIPEIYFRVTVLGSQNSVKDIIIAPEL